VDGGTAVSMPEVPLCLARFLAGTMSAMSCNSVAIYDLGNAFYLLKKHTHPFPTPEVAG
jgi:hypothetical protein